MRVKANRSTPFIIGLVIAAFVAGLALALVGPEGQILPTIVAAASIIAGLVLLTSRSLFKAEHGMSAGSQSSAKYLATRQMRVSGAAGILFGLALVIPETRIRTAVMLCAAAVSIAGVFKVPKRLFIVEEPVE